MDKLIYCGIKTSYKTRISWLNCALIRDDEAVYWVSIGQQWLVLSQYEVVPVGNLCDWVSKGQTDL